MMRKIEKLGRLLLLAWPPKICLQFPNNSTATSVSGKRYGAFLWLSVSLGHYHWNIWPRHVKGFWGSYYVKETLEGKKVRNPDAKAVKKIKALLQSSRSCNV